ncbi:MAG: hypothetical protein D6698_16690 [Gammaproteobacteria bacterium]|nr:MAG: hypothetical protein D6698_16690 [Gammaproteobacteria bacterium]
MAASSQLLDTVSRAIGAEVARVREGYTRLLDDFISLKASPDIIALRVFPDVKEITEAMGMLRSVPRERYGEDLTAVVVGDGSTPRLGALLAHVTKWQVHSIDPRLRAERIPTWTSKVRRLHIWPQKFQNAPVRDADLLFLPHAHVSVREAMRAILGPQGVCYFNPCCTKPDLEPEVVKVVLGILSPHNRILVYRMPI